MLHDQERPVLGAAVVVYLDDIGVVQCGDRLCFGQKPHDRGFAPSRLAENPLDGNLAVEPSVGGEEYGAHSALSERPLDLVAGRKIDDFDVVDHCVEAGRVTAANGPLVAKAHVGPLRPGRRLPGKRRVVAEAVGFIHRRYSLGPRVIPAGIWPWSRE